jgi:uncharacterized protein (TIGR03503 family)
LVNVNHAISQESEKQNTQKSRITLDKDKPLEKGKIGFYQSDNVTNEIPYFDNRFRIDAKLEEITLIFFRDRGSKPIILVQPDGKKLRVNDYDDKKVEWHDDRTFDMIKINKPMPGPWQAIGDILPESKILVVSDVKIEVDPLPEIVLSGETLKVVGKLYNGDEKIDVAQFNDVVKLHVNFFSTNNSDYDNFGADALKLTSFQDDGEDLDEYAGDSLYTGEFILDFAAGEWQPVFLIKLPLVTRELRQKPILLHKSPITISVETSEVETTPHHLLLTIDPTHVDPSSLVFQGKTTFPDKQTRPFSIIDDANIENPTSRHKDISYTEPGIHRVNVSAFGRTTSGREFRLVVPEFTFNVKGDLNISLLPTFDNESVEQIISIDKEEQSLADIEVKLEEEKAKQQQIEDEKSMQTIIMIVAGNAVIIVLALVLFLFMRKRKAK